MNIFPILVFIGHFYIRLSYVSLLYFALYVTDILYECKIHVEKRSLSLSLCLAISLSLPLHNISPSVSVLPMALVQNSIYFWGLRTLVPGVIEHIEIKPLSQRTALLKHMLFCYFLSLSGHSLCHLRTESPGPATDSKHWELIKWSSYPHFPKKAKLSVLTCCATPVPHSIS